jgi:hypothetical protein
MAFQPAIYGKVKKLKIAINPSTQGKAGIEV